MLGNVLDFVAAETTTRRNFELLQSVLHLFLQIHGEYVAAQPALKAKAAALKAHLAAAWGKLDVMIQDARCMVSFFAGQSG
jgi:hypothetical protein